jgi:hypothetical protein
LSCLAFFREFLSLAIVVVNHHRESLDEPYVIGI